MEIDGPKLKLEMKEARLQPASVSAEAGISVATLFNVFSNKPGTFRSAQRVQSALQRLKARQAAEPKAS